MARQRSWSVLVVAVVLAVPAAAAPDESWVGRTVFVKRAGVTFGYVEGGKWVNAGEVAELAVPVLERRGDWVLVRSGGKRGWVKTDDVLPETEAVAYFTGLVEAQPRNPSLYLRRAAVWLEREDYERAAADCTLAIRLDPASPAAHYTRAMARHLGRQYDVALADYAATIRLAPEHPGAYAGRAWLRATCPDARYRDGEAAVKDARRACELSRWADPNCLDTLAAACAEDNRFEEAIKWQEKALESPRFRGAGRASAVERVQLYRLKTPYRTEGRY
jgi:hypothetical protein